MRRIKSIILLSLIVGIFQNAFAQNGQREWKLVANIPEDSINSGGVLFTDALHGYLSGGKPNAFLSYKNCIFYSTIDGGMSWQKIDFHNVFGADTVFYDLGYTHFFSIGMYVSSPNTVMFSNGTGYGQNPSSVDSLAFYWSDNSGDSWSRFRTQPVAPLRRYKIEAAPHYHEVIALDMNNYDGFNKGKFYLSETFGKSFDQMRWDSTLLKNISMEGFTGSMGNVNNHAFDYSDDSTWIIIVSDSNNVHGNPDMSRPYSLVTLLTHDAGHSWQAYRNNIPHFPSSQIVTPFDIHCVRGTPYIYLFSVTSAEGGVVYSTSIQNYGFPNYGVNFVYSSDYGVTWNVDTSFSTNRRGYEAAAPGDLWVTVTPHDSDRQTAAAGWIAHTTNNGQTWNIDSTSLYNDGYYDARVVSFSGKNNGWIYAQRLDRKKIAIFKYTGSDGVTPDSYHFRLNTSNKIFYTLYPNPASNEIQVQLTSKEKITNIDLFDILGRKWTCPYDMPEDFSVHIQTGELRSGCYLLHIAGQYGNYMAPFMVQH